MSTSFFFFNDTATTEIYTLSLHDALPIFGRLVDHQPGHTALGVQGKLHVIQLQAKVLCCNSGILHAHLVSPLSARSEEHTSELQSRQYLVCRLLLEKKKQLQQTTTHNLCA